MLVMLRALPELNSTYLLRWLLAVPESAELQSWNPFLVRPIIDDGLNRERAPVRNSLALA